AENVGTFHQLGELFPQFVAPFFQDLNRLVDIGVVGDADIHQGLHIAPGMVGERADLPVGNKVEVAANRPDLHEPKARLFDNTGGPADGDILADVDLVFRQDKEAGDDVANQPLGTETDGQSDDAGTGDDGGGIDAKLP